MASAVAQTRRVEQDLARRRTLAARQVISREDLAHAQATVDAARAAQDAARAAMESAREQLTANRELTQGSNAATPIQSPMRGTTQGPDAWAKCARSSKPKPARAKPSEWKLTQGR